MTTIKKNERKQLVKQDINKLLQKEVTLILKNRGVTKDIAVKILEDILIWVHLVINNNL